MVQLDENGCKTWNKSTNSYFLRGFLLSIIQKIS